MAYIVMALYSYGPYIVMADIVVAYVVVAHIVMAHAAGSSSLRRCNRRLMRTRCEAGKAITI